MKKITALILPLTIAFNAFGQTLEPQILILTPNEFKYEKTFEQVLKLKNKQLSKKTTKEQFDYLKSDEFKNQPENIQRIERSEIKFTEKLDFSKQVSFIAHQYLSYRFYEHFTNLLILLSVRKSNGNLSELKGISDKDKMQYVLNFSRIELFKKDEISYAKILVQLYDNISGSIIINSEYQGDWTNPGFEFACSDKSIDCTVSNALSKALEDVIYQVTSNSPTIKRERDLAQLRFNKLVTKYYSKPNNKDFLKPIITTSDSNIVLDDQYQILVDSTQTKFIAFFIKQVSDLDFRIVNENKRDGNINIISSKDIKDEGLLDDIPKTYAYIVQGARHKDKWYFEKTNITYFEAKSLEDGRQKYFYNLVNWNFFKENSTEFNPAFWEGNLFKIKERISYSEGISKYKKEGEIALKFEEKIISEIITPFLERIKTDNDYEVASLSHMAYKYLLIYPKEKNVILSPIKVKEKNGEMFLRYFVLISNGDKYDIYEWSYLDQKSFKNSKLGPSFMEQINTLTTWNYSYKKLDDTEFWEKYILARTGDNYKYLTKRQ